MPRFIAIATISLVFLFLGYAASGIGTAGTTLAADSASSSTGSSISTSTTATTTTTAPTTSTTPAPIKTTICHRTNSKKHPYLRMRVSVAALGRHMRHKGDIIPAPGGVCPRHVVKVRNHHVVYKPWKP
jgi:hypothetical protein